MKLSASTWIFGDEPFEATAQRLARFGCDGVEPLGEPERFDPHELRETCARHGLVPYSVLAMATGRRDLAHPEPDVRAHGERYLASVLAFAEALGASIVSTIPGSVARVDPVGVEPTEDAWSAGYEREWDLAVASVRRAGQEAGARGIVLAVEPINRYETHLLRTAEQARRFVAEVGSPAVKVQLDTFHMSIEESDPAAAIRATSRDLVNLHLADSNRRAVGDGRLDWPAILAALLEIGYQGPLTLEPAPPEPNLSLAVRMRRNLPLRDRDIEVSVAHLRRVLGGVAMGRPAGHGSV